MQLFFLVCVMCLTMMQAQSLDKFEMKTCEFVFSVIFYSPVSLTLQ